MREKFSEWDLSFSSIPLTRPQLAFGTRGRKSGEMIFIRGISGAAEVWGRGGKRADQRERAFVSRLKWPRVPVAQLWRVKRRSVVDRRKAPRKWPFDPVASSPVLLEWLFKSRHCDSLVDCFRLCAFPPTVSNRRFDFQDRKASDPDLIFRGESFKSSKSWWWN